MFYTFVARWLFSKGQEYFIKQDVGDSSFAPVRCNNCMIRVQFLFGYTSVATNCNKEGLF